MAPTPPEHGLNREPNGYGPREILVTSRPPAGGEGAASKRASGRAVPCSVRSAAAHLTLKGTHFDRVKHTASGRELNAEPPLTARLAKRTASSTRPKPNCCNKAPKLWSRRLGTFAKSRPPP